MAAWVKWVNFTHWISMSKMCMKTITDWFGTKQKSVWFQINRKMVNKIWFRVDLIRFRKDFSVCTIRQENLQQSGAQLSERLASMKPLQHRGSMVPGVWGAFNWVPPSLPDSWSTFFQPRFKNKTDIVTWWLHWKKKKNYVEH